MKWWKKLLITLGILLALGLGLLVYGAFKATDMYTEKVEPELKSYVQMDKAQQDKYIFSRMEELMKGIKSEDDHSEVSIQVQLEAMEKDEAIRRAGVEMGRSLCAHLIGITDSVNGTLSPEDKAAYEREAEALEERSDVFEKMVKDFQERTAGGSPAGDLL